MENQTDADVLIELIKSRKLDLQAGTFDLLEEPVKLTLIDWLESKNFPSEPPTDSVGNEYVVAWFEPDHQLFIFTLSIEDAEVCAGTIIIAFDGKEAKYVADTVQCSD